jgi:hypothetical protein
MDKEGELAIKTPLYTCFLAEKAQIFFLTPLVFPSSLFPFDFLRRQDPNFSIFSYSAKCRKGILPRCFNDII